MPPEYRIGCNFLRLRALVDKLCAVARLKSLHLYSALASRLDGFGKIDVRGWSHQYVIADDQPRRLKDAQGERN
jgi:hypothetical protein